MNIFWRFMKLLKLNPVFGTSQNIAKADHYGNNPSDTGMPSTRVLITKWTKKTVWKSYIR